MDSLAASYSPRHDATPEAEIDTLADAYAYILRCAAARLAEEMKKAARPGGPDDAEESKNDRTAESDCTRN